MSKLRIIYLVKVSCPEIGTAAVYRMIQLPDELFLIDRIIVMMVLNVMRQGILRNVNRNAIIT